MSQILFADGNLFFNLDGHFIKNTLCSSFKLCNNIYLLLHQYFFSVKQANKICTKLSSHF